MEVNNLLLDEFKKEVKEYLHIDNDIKKLMEAVKERKKRKKILSTSIISFMKTHNIQDLNSEDGRLKYSVSKTAKSLSKQHIYQSLSKFMKSNDKAQEALSFIYNNREKVETYKLKKLKPLQSQQLDKIHQ